VSVALVLPGQLRPLAEGRSTVLLDGAAGTVGRALAQLRAEFPAIHDRIFTERGELRPHVNVFVGKTDIRWSGGLETPVEEGAELVILPSVSGG
jgi:molybdopterin converting factor small subunit